MQKKPKVPPIRPARAKKSTPPVPLPKYHVDYKSWDRKAVMTVICEQLASTSKGVARICREDPELPTIDIIYKWLAEESASGITDVLYMYENARAAQMDFMADECIDIVDNEAVTTVLVDGLPLMINGEIVGRVDLKADRAVKTLRVNGAFAEPAYSSGDSRTSTASHLASELVEMAQWLDLNRVVVERNGNLATQLRSAFKANNT